MQKKFTIFFPYTKSAKQKLRNKQNFEYKISQNILFRKHQIQKKYFCEKKNFCQKKFDKKNFHQKKNCRKKNFIKKISAIFLYLKKKSVEIRLIFEKKMDKNFENNLCNFFIFEKKSDKSRFSVETSVTQLAREGSFHGLMPSLIKKCRLPTACYCRKSKLRIGNYEQLRTQIVFFLFVRNSFICIPHISKSCRLLFSTFTLSTLFTLGPD